MWVKICGNTTLDDALLAADAGADAVGFVFTPGKRTVTADEVAAITPHLPPALEKIGVFTTTGFAEITETAERAGLTGIQLHGPFHLDLLQQLRLHFDQTSRNSLIQVLPWWTDAPAAAQHATLAAEAEEIARDGSADAILIDSRTRTASGGTGTPLDWPAARDALSRAAARIILAGGLDPDNVEQAIHVFQPWGVDVASGVESAPRRKNSAAVEAFIRKAKQAGLAAAKLPDATSAARR